LSKLVNQTKNIGQIIIAFVKLFISGDRDISLAIFVICMAVILLALSLMKFKAYA
jgi:flagellar biosynthesis component FlhA